MKKIMEKHGAIEYFAEALHYFYDTEFINRLIENAMLITLRALRTLDDAVSLRVMGMMHVFMYDMTKTCNEDLRTIIRVLKRLVKIS
jgi:hypothetical protein